MFTGLDLTGKGNSSTLLTSLKRCMHLLSLLIKAKKAYVCHLNEEQIGEYRSIVKEPGRLSPYPNRSVEEN